MPAPLFDVALLQPFCRRTSFGSGELLRQKGQHYRDMLLIVDGRVDVYLTNRDANSRVTISASGSPVGEIGFLRGCAATATVIARTPGQALVIDDPSLARLESEQGSLASKLLNHLAETAAERTSFNLTLGPSRGTYGAGRRIEVLLCRNAEMLENAKRLRYAVYCEELGRDSPYADHQTKTISDPLDAFGHTFVAIEDGETIGTLRGNMAAEGSLGHLEELYGMRQSAFHPGATAICTKFIVKKSRRGSPAAIKLISALTGFGVRHKMRECYIDCVPNLLPYYRAIGFTIVGPRFFHRENGPSYPMMIDLAVHGEKLAREGGARRYLKTFVKAQAIRFIDRLRGRGR